MIKEGIIWLDPDDLSEFDLSEEEKEKRLKKTMNAYLVGRYLYIKHTNEKDIRRSNLYIDILDRTFNPTIDFKNDLYQYRMRDELIKRLYKNLKCKGITKAWATKIVDHVLSEINRHIKKD